MPEFVQVHRDGPIATIELSNPDRANAMSVAMAHEFRGACEELACSTSLRAVIVTGTGRYFAAGGALDMLEEVCSGPHDDERRAENARNMETYYGCFLAIRDVPVPVIAAVNGPAVGAGLCLALACDIRLVSTQAKLGVTFTRLGIHPGLGATWFLPRIVGTERATLLLCTGRTISGPEAVEAGLAVEAYAPDELLPAARSLANEIADCAPLANRLVKESLRRSPDDDLATRLAAEAKAQSETYAHPDALEGIRAFQARRAPRFGQ